MGKKKTSSKTEKELSKLSFEEAIEALSEIVEKIETGQVPLQESLQQYEKGMGLIGRCRRILEDAEKRIARIDALQEQAEDEEEDTDEEESEKEGLF